MQVNIIPGKGAGTVKAPPSKSFAHRMLLCGALAEEQSVISGISQSQDMLATLDCLTALGGSYTMEGDTVTLRRGDSLPLSHAVYPCRESGSTLRFFIPLALALGQGGCFTGTRRLMERSISVYEEIFGEKGISVEKTGESITVRGKLPSGVYRLRGDVSSQFVTGLLYALPLLEGDSLLQVLPPVESRGYIDITLTVLRQWGITVEEVEENTFRIPGNQSYRGRTQTVEGDWSNAAFLFAMNHLGHDINITGLNHESIQGDRVCLAYLEALETAGGVLDLSHCPDLGPILFAVAAAKHGGTFTGTRRLRIKESDRAMAMAQELEKFGITTIVEENRVTVQAGTLKTPTVALDGHNDHRIVMSMAVLATLTGGVIREAEAVRKSYPDFFAVLHHLGIRGLNL